MIHSSFEAAIAALESASCWSVKIARRSDNQTCMVLDHTGTFLVGPIDSKDKDDFVDCPTILTTTLIHADNYVVYATDCKWKE